MSVTANKIIWLGNSYGIEFIITDQYTINFNVIKKGDRTLIDNRNIDIGSYTCHRDFEINEKTQKAIPGTEENMRDFATRSYKEGVSFAEEMISEHKETQDLSTIFDEVCDDNSKGVTWL